MTIAKIKAHLTMTKELEVTSFDSGKILAIVADFLAGKVGLATTERLIKHFSETNLVGVIKRVVPFYTLLLLDGEVDAEEFAKHLLKQDARAKDITGFCPDAELKDRLYRVYDKLIGEAVAEEAPLAVDDFKLFLPSEKERKTLDAVLDSVGLPAFDKIYGQVAKAASSVAQVDALRASVAAAVAKHEQEEKELRDKLEVLMADLAKKPYEDISIKSDGVIPNGKVTMKPANEVFTGVKSKMLVPVWEWDGVHPQVPAINSEYIFREGLLMRVLYALVTNQRMYLQGHTGSGKTTLIEQVAAHLGYPFVRINFDSEITRMDLIGRDTLVQEGGTTTSKFVEGLLPQMMTAPCIGCFDEIDFCRPDVAYVMQSALENNSIRLTEDGGREIKPHPMFRMFATGNTVGQGDEHGMYQGARPQSLAFLDRFTVWAKVEYLDETQRLKLIKNNAPSLTEDTSKTLNKYVSEHLVGFKDGKVLQPISPRGMIAVAKATAHLEANGSKGTAALREALYMTVLDRASEADFATLKGIVDRVTK